MKNTNMHKNIKNIIKILSIKMAKTGNFGQILAYKEKRWGILTFLHFVKLCIHLRDQIVNFWPFLSRFPHIRRKYEQFYKI